MKMKNGFDNDIIVGIDIGSENIFCSIGSIENEKNNNPRLQVSSKEEYADIMNNLNLANPKMMDVAVPANVKGLTLDNIN